MRLSSHVLIYFSTIILSFELFKLFYGQPVSETVIKFLFFECSLVSLVRFARVYALICFTFEALESIAWYFTGCGFNAQVLIAIDLCTVLAHRIEIVYAVIALFIIVCFLALFPCFAMNNAMISGHYFWFFPFLSFALFFPLYQYLEANMDPFHRPLSLPPEVSKLYFQSLRGFFGNPIRAAIRNPDSPKNLIILEIRSMEQQVLGLYNSMFPESMPYMSQLSQSSAFASQIVSTPYTTSSISSLFASQCNLPLLINSSKLSNSGGFPLLEQHRCISDYLHAAGYNLHSYLTPDYIGQFKPFLRLHHYDVAEHTLKYDWDLFEYLTETLLTNLSAPTEQPFILHIANGDTTGCPRYYVDQRCQTRVPRYPLVLRSFDCLDQILERFIEVFKASSLSASTEIFIYGNHLITSGVHRQVQLFEPRYLTAMLPLRPRELLTKKMSIYDFAPTLLELVGIDYEPKFPFGTSFFALKSGLLPDPTHFQFIYNFFRTALAWNESTECYPGILPHDITDLFASVKIL
jgi:hypothetical protein